MPSAVTYPTVYARDVASFVPAVASFVSEPAGAGLVGKPTNFVAAASMHDRSGTLLGFPVTVRFVPAGFTFDYGDGATLSTQTGGTMWAATGMPQFTATPTSHAYAARGTYTATVAVSYAAEVNFGDGQWRPVIGLVTATSPGYTVQIYQPKTALVGKTCLEDPSGVGC